VIIVTAVVLWRSDDSPVDEAAQHHSGTVALEYDRRARCVVNQDTRPIVLDSGLVDGRGIAFETVDASGGQAATLYVADAWEGVYSFQFKANAPPYPLPKPKILAHTTKMCPEGYCEQAQYGGLIVQHQKLVLSDAHRQQLLIHHSNGLFQQLGGPVLRSVTDVEWLPERHAYVVVDTSGAASVARARSGGSDMPNGEIALVPEDFNGGERKSIVKDLHRPVGVVWSSRTKRLYVADIEADAEVWSYYISVPDDKWIKGGTLWRQDVGPFSEAIRLQDMVVADFDPKSNEGECKAQSDGDEMIIAAGPDGIYFFHADGNLLAKYYLGRPVAGLTWGPIDLATGFNCLYFTSGPQIGALKTRLKERAVS